MYKNSCIKCDVEKCKHNADGCNCELESIKVTCGCGEQCTCCGDYSEKE
ncbi:MAG: DUF1540 domain-containing protein [Clostridia bacterium]|nr:DUF1540 domain-containing protein [Clostridia bacterium]